MNNKNSQKSQFLVVKDTIKDVFVELNSWVKKIKEKFYGLYGFGIYLFIVLAFALIYTFAYWHDSNNFLVSNSELNQNIKTQSMAILNQELASINNDLNAKKIELNRLKSANEALNQFDKYYTTLLIRNNIRPDSIIYFNKYSFRLRMIKKNTIRYLVEPVFENKKYQYEIIANYRQLDYFFYNKNYPIEISIAIKNKGFKKIVYFERFSYRSAEVKNNRKYIDIKIFYERSIKLLNYWIKDRIPEREKEYQDLKGRQEVVLTQLKDSNHYLSFWDFLYFSTITQSSTGYGDILPNSGLVRMIVTIQIILGLFVLGILINNKSKDK